MEKNLTSGSVLKNLVYFSLPYLLSYFLQTLYGMADLFIIGQFEGVAGTTAVSVGSQVMHMLTVMIVGLAMGATVSIGQAVGAKDRKKAADCTGNTVTVFLVLSVILTAVLLLSVRGIVSVMSTPEEAVAGNGSLSDSLLSRHSFYHCLQYHQLYFPRPGRFQKSHVLYRRGLRSKYCAGLPFYGSVSPGTCRALHWELPSPRQSVWACPLPMMKKRKTRHFSS